MGPFRRASMPGGRGPRAVQSPRFQRRAAEGGAADSARTQPGGHMQNMPLDAIPVDCGIQRMWGVRDLTRSRLGPSIVRSFMVRSFMLSVPRIAPENTGPTLSRPPLAAADRQGEGQTLGATGPERREHVVARGEERVRRTEPRRERLGSKAAQRLVVVELGGVRGPEHRHEARRDSDLPGVLDEPGMPVSASTLSTRCTSSPWSISASPWSD